MNDKEMTIKCAEAMGIELCPHPDCARYPLVHGDSHGHYDPLNDDAQAMALLKKFAKTIVRRKEGDWSINLDGARSVDLNRAIVQCVATISA